MEDLCGGVSLSKMAWMGLSFKFIYEFRFRSVSFTFFIYILVTMATFWSFLVVPCICRHIHIHRTTRCRRHGL